MATSHLQADTFPSATLAGSYQALLYNTDEATGTPAGRVTLTVGTTGSFTGSVVTADYKTYSVRGLFVYDALAGTATVLNGVNIPRTGVGILPLNLGLTLTNSTQILAVNLTGDALPHVSTTSFRNLTLVPKTTAPFAGKYTLAMNLASAAGVGTPSCSAMLSSP